jgi:hypothetical protein
MEKGKGIAPLRMEEAAQPDLQDYPVRNYTISLSELQTSFLNKD